MVIVWECENSSPLFHVILNGAMFLFCFVFGRVEYLLNANSFLHSSNGCY